MRAEVHGQTEQGYQAIIDALASRYAAAPGFVAHLSHPIAGGWCVLDVWQSRELFERFFAQHVAPRLAPGVRPKVTLVELHDLWLPPAAGSAAAAAD